MASAADTVQSAECKASGLLQLTLPGLAGGMARDLNSQLPDVDSRRQSFCCLLPASISPSTSSHPVFVP
ncbi:hypothetical protein N7532_009313 [Penicillium argentinense]|uniref:Uncharacterized protein n=1 Tax=Penicillium argentinense TaxID=1131581 RepID=A0A9W9K2E2_9EURO|nr:uncharacterized protein N7532_009313 [Penicillium argentinense]KAJ5090629.1 hypothetical protein N7532_009313 [Penicillium argentinense]